MKNFNRIFSVAAIATLSVAGLSAQTPDDPKALNLDPAEVGVIYAADQDKFFEVLRDGNGNPASDWTQPVWGQKVVTSDDECNGGASAIRIDNLDFLPMQFPAVISLAQWRYLHIDIWAPADDELCFKFQNYWPSETYVTDIYKIKGGEWNNIDIDMEDPDYFQWSEQKTDPETQEKYTNKPVNVLQIAGEKIANDYPHCATIYMTNIIAHNTNPEDLYAEEEEEAGVNGIVTDSYAKGRCYNVYGVEVDENYTGIVIRDGRKYIQR